MLAQYSGALYLYVSALSSCESLNRLPYHIGHYALITVPKIYSSRVVHSSSLSRGCIIVTYLLSFCSGGNSNGEVMLLLRTDRNKMRGVKITKIYSRQIDRATNSQIRRNAFFFPRAEHRPQLLILQAQFIGSPGAVPVAPGAPALK
jgi:hypothetical protein